MVKVSGVKKTLEEVREKIKIYAKNALPKEIKAIEKELVEATPIDTGNARRGWKSDNDSISNDVEYIAKLNEGTSKQAPAYFIEKIVLTHRSVTPSGIIVRKI